MRQTPIALILAAAITLGGGAAMLSRADAQGAPGGPPPSPPPGMEGGFHRPMGGPPGGPMDGRMHGPGRWRMMHRLREFALIFPAKDRALSGPDVQKIAEAFLLFNGNHTWKVTDVTEQPDSVRFAFATADGAPIAHFAMDRHTGRPTRVD